MVSIYNSLTQQKDILKPKVDGHIKMYVCGMTVYDYCHLGHARVLVSFDMMTRYLRHLGYTVTYVRNITDIDDKIINRANENQEPYTELTARFIDAMHEDERALNVLPPDIEPRATEYIPQIIELVERLVAKGYAYVAESGDVYYDVSQFKDYGKLSKKDLSGQQAGHRVEVVKDKRNPLDFVLWKSAKPHEPHWSSPWGAGRPGWHIECSAMSIHTLGENFDIHGGGFDLQFPHHENEIAQSEAACGCDFANVWMHVGYLQINAEKMSKSLGNFFTIREILEKYPAEVVRYFLISSHYRSQLNYSLDNLNNAKSGLSRLYLACRDSEVVEAIEDMEITEAFHAAMQDDFNTPEALAVLFTLANKINVTKKADKALANGYVALLRQLGEILGILQQDAEVYFQGDVQDEQVSQIENLIADRTKARADKNWQAADEIRDQLQAMGIEIEDTPSGTIWRRG